MGNKFVIAIFLCIFAVSAAAQDLDPTVEVRREYEGELVEVHKPVFEMAVPDSVTRFALDFDYSVFENPYRGSYEFAPYLLSMKPSALDNGESSFYLRAGAGYQLHPTLDLVWSPKFKRKGLNMDVYALHRSFVGNYHTIEPESLENGDVVLTALPKNENGSHKWFGYDMLTMAGAELRHDWEKIALDYSAGYYGLLQEDRVWNRGYNALDASLGIQTKPAGRHSLAFDMDLDYRLGEDVVAGSSLIENLGSLDMGVGPFSVGKMKMAVDAEANVASYAGAFDLLAGDVSVNPHFVFGKDRFTADLGVRISKLLGEKDVKEQYVYPDVKISCVLFPTTMKFYLRATGGGEFEDYSSTIASNHHVNHLMPSGALGYRVERFGLTAGFDGRISGVFSYNLRGGYANYSSLRHYTLNVVSNPSFSMIYIPCQKWFAAIDWALDVEGFRFDGTVAYEKYSDQSSHYDESADVMGQTVLRPASLTGKAAIEYNWKKRVVCGVNCEFSGPLQSCYEQIDLGAVREVAVPGYADLGVYAEYATVRNLSVWMRAGNLLNMTIQRTPLYAEKGVHFTLGICMNL